MRIAKYVLKEIEKSWNNRNSSGSMTRVNYSFTEQAERSLKKLIEATQNDINVRDGETAKSEAVRKIVMNLRANYGIAFGNGDTFDALMKM